MSASLKEFYKNNPEAKEKISKKFKELWKDPEFIKKVITKEKYEKISEKAKGRFVTEETRKKISETLKDKWKNDPEFVAEYFKAMSVSPNKLETYFEAVLQENFPNEWEFVGDGELIVGTKCPDFSHKEKKLLIELYGNYWHDNDDPQDRIDEFTPFGYNTLVLWESEVNTNIKECIKKVKEFSHT